MTTLIEFIPTIHLYFNNWVVYNIFFLQRNRRKAVQNTRLNCFLDILIYFV